MVKPGDLVIPVGFYQVAFHHHIENSLHEPVATMGVEYTGANFNGDVDALAVGWGEVIERVNRIVTFSRMTVSIQAGATVDIAYDNPPGQVQDEAEPVNCAFLLRKITSVPGRQFRGRMYVPGVSTTDVDHLGQVSASAQARLQLGLNAATSAWAAAHWKLVLLHNQVEEPSITPAPTPLTAISWSPSIATQRRRMARAT